MRRRSHSLLLCFSFCIRLPHTRLGLPFCSSFNAQNGSTERLNGFFDRGYSQQWSLRVPRVLSRRAESGFQKLFFVKQKLFGWMTMGMVTRFMSLSAPPGLCMYTYHPGKRGRWLLLFFLPSFLPFISSWPKSIPREFDEYLSSFFRL